MNTRMSSSLVAAAMLMTGMIASAQSTTPESTPPSSGAMPAYSGTRAGDATSASCQNR